MEKQVSFSELEYSGKRKKTKREIFLEAMEQIVPLEMMCEIIRPHYAVAGNGRQPIELKKMIKMYLISQWYNLSDEMTEDTIYENQAVRRYVGIELAQENAPDRTTLGKFRASLEKHGLNKKIFEEMNKRFKEQGIILREGTIVDATIIQAPASTRNKTKSRDPEMSSTKKNNNHHFGFKAHIGVDKESGLIHDIAVTTAKTADIEAAASVMHGEEKEILGDAGFIGLEKREDIINRFGQEPIENLAIAPIRRGPKAKVKPQLKKEICVKINRRRMKIHKMPDGEEKDRLKAEEKAKSQIRAKVEYPFRIMKVIFGFRKTRYKGLDKNENKLYMLFGLVNLYFVMQKNKLSTQKA